MEFQTKKRLERGYYLSEAICFYRKSLEVLVVNFILAEVEMTRYVSTALL